MLQRIEENIQYQDQNIKVLTLIGFVLMTTIFRLLNIFCKLELIFGKLIIFRRLVKIIHQLINKCIIWLRARLFNISAGVFSKKHFTNELIAITHFWSISCKNPSFVHHEDDWSNFFDIHSQLQWDIDHFWKSVNKTFCIKLSKFLLFKSMAVALIHVLELFSVHWRTWNNKIF